MICTIIIDGKPACQRPADSLELLKAARAIGVLLCCTYDDRQQADRAARLYQTIGGYKNVEVVDGLVPHGDEQDNWD